MKKIVLLIVCLSVIGFTYSNNTEESITSVQPGEADAVSVCDTVSNNQKLREALEVLIHADPKVLDALNTVINKEQQIEPSAKTKPADTFNRRLYVAFDIRADWQYNVSGIDSIRDSHAFTGKFLNFMLQGDINKYFSYKFRYRLNKLTKLTDFFEATDYAILTCQFNKNWSVSAGKLVVGIGGFEYDKAPIDVFFWSGYELGIPSCYEFGIQGKYTTSDGKNDIVLQITNSPFTSATYRFENKYAYNLVWYGNYKYFQSIYSLNFMEYDQNKFINYIALGNKFNIDPVSIELDYMNRYGGRGGFFNDFSIIGKVIYTHKYFDVYLKGGYDYNMSQSATDTDIMDLTVLPGTKYAFYGAGINYYPIKDSKDVRIHAFWHSNNDNFKAHVVGIGVKCLLRAVDKK
ncbi:MAG: OprO/OprP family phosphate-selective porin [Bacteroidales bacterium]|nr:OprO/OprP family phosphate-selective porin [Bacteroidales bacterium]MDY5194099.1 porin [Candidatus Aphodosoma sp.]